MQSLPIMHGRGAVSNPPIRFERMHVEEDFAHFDGDEEFAESLSREPMHYYLDASRNIIARNDSPDVGFEFSINPYRGCEHGCIYCYARQTHEYLGFSSGLDFETKIMVKADAAALLREALQKPGYNAAPIHLSGVTDCYQPIERKLKITRQCLEVFHECSHPVSIITKNHLVTRDIDLLADLARKNAAVVSISVTTLDQNLSRIMEPRTSVPRRRLDAIRELSASGIPVNVMVAPIIPGLTDHEVPAILKAVAEAGARSANYTIVRLPFVNKELLVDWLTQHFPDRKDKVLNRIRELRQGKLNDSNFGTRSRGTGLWSEQIASIFALAKRNAGLDRALPPLSCDHFTPPAQAQMTLW